MYGLNPEQEQMYRDLMPLGEEGSHPLLDNLEKGNIIDQLKDNTKAYQDSMERYNEAVQSMDGWIKKYERAMKLAKLQPTHKDQDIDHKTFPFDGASLAMMPYITEAMLDFNSRAAPELVWADKIVSAKIYGKEYKAPVPPEMGPEQQQEFTAKFNEGLKKSKAERGERVATYINYQLTEEIPYWRDSQDKLLMGLPCIGTVYKRSYWDGDRKLICSEMIKADKVIFDMNCNNFDESMHKFMDIQCSRNELIAYIRGEQKWDIDEDDLEEDKKTFDFIQAYTFIDVDDDGIEEPYLAILDKESQKIVYLTPNYDEDTIDLNDSGDLIRIEEVKCFTQYRFLPDPDGGPMGLGWGILLGPMFTAINNNMRQLIDAGTIANTSANTGLIAAGVGQGRGNRQEAGPVEMVMGQLSPVPMGSAVGSLRDSIVQFPFAGPNATLFALLQYMIESARSMTTAAVNVEAHQGEAASLYLARLQQGLKVPNSIIMRVYEASKCEFKKIHTLNYKHHDSKKYNKVLDEETEHVMADDFNPEDCDIRLVADPAQGSDIERAARAESNLRLGMELSAAGQQVVNIREAAIRLMKATNTEEIETLVPEPDPNPSPEMQMMIAEKQMEAELKQKDQALREKGQQIQEMKMAHEAAKTMSELGLKEDEQEAKITKLYADALKALVEAGIAAGEEAFEAARQIEENFIDSKGGVNANSTINSNPNPGGALAGRSSNQSVPRLSEMVSG